MYFRIIIALFITLPFYGQNSIDEALNRYNSHSVDYIRVKSLEENLKQDEKIYLLDAREKEEFEVSHLKDAIFVGYSSLELSALENIDKNSTVVVYCSIGVRSEEVGEQLQKMGYQNVYNLYGGIFEWVNSSNSVYQDGKPTNKVHAYDSYWGKFLKNAEKVY